MEIEGSQAVLNCAYVYANGKLIAEQTPDGQFYWTHNDHLNSTRKLTNTSGVSEQTLYNRMAAWFSSFQVLSSLCSEQAGQGQPLSTASGKLHTPGASAAYRL